MPIAQQVTYLRRINLGDYNHEEIAVTLAPDPEHMEQPEEKPDALLREARRLVATHTTAYLRKQADKEGK
jgi:hypothetical protein